MRKIFFLFTFHVSLFTFSLLPSAHPASDTAIMKQDLALIKGNLENANAKLAEAMNQLTTLQQEINSMKGVTESGNYYFNEQTRAIREYDQRIRALEDKMGALMTLLREIKEGATPVGKSAGATDEGQTREFQRLLDSVMSEDYNKALPGFLAFLQKYPKSTLADHAQYWVAESYYSLNDYKKAISEYQILIQKYPRSAKAKTALFKQGLSFMGLKMYTDAKPFFEKVIAEFPNTSEAAQAVGRIKEIDRLVAAGPPVSPGPGPSSGNLPPPTSPSPGPAVSPPPPPSPTVTQPRPAPPPSQRPATGSYYD